MTKYLTGIGHVLHQIEHHGYLTHPPGSRAAMRADLEYDLGRAKELRPTLAPEDQARLDAEAKEARSFLENFELAESALPVFWPPVHPSTTH